MHKGRVLEEREREIRERERKVSDKEQGRKEKEWRKKGEIELTKENKEEVNGR